MSRTTGAFTVFEALKAGVSVEKYTTSPKSTVVFV
jgi:hypothetical protein